MMTKDRFLELLDSLPEARAGSMFGYPCLKLGRKPFAFWSIDTDNSVAFKLNEVDHERALGLAEARLFNPGGKNKPMRNWVELPSSQSHLWSEFALLACKHLREEINGS